MKPLVVLTRTNKIESIHKGYICIADSNNNVIYNIGEPSTRMYLRSSAKPIQAVALAHSGALEKYDISPKELAVICSSHSGEDFHREAVLSILHKIGLNEDYLECGCANPYNKDMNEALIRKGEKPTALYNCCSGKHAGMLALCKYYNYPLEKYTERDHPVQQLIIKVISELLGCSISDINLGFDNCGVPNYLLSMQQAAYLYALLVNTDTGMNKYGKSLEIIRKAMLSHPEMINGDGEFCTDLMVHSNRRAICKVGGEGVYCIGVPEKSLGVSIKILDGNERAVYPVAVRILKILGVIGQDSMTKLKCWGYPEIKDHKGRVIGHTIPVFDKEDNAEAEISIGKEFKYDMD